MAETTPLGAIDIDALMATAIAAAAQNKENVKTARKNAESKKLRDKVANIVRLKAEQSDALAAKATTLAEYIVAEVGRQAESGKTKPEVLKAYVKKYNSLVQEQTKIADAATGLSTGALKLNTKGKIVSTGVVIPKTPSQSTPPNINISVSGTGGNVQGPLTGNPPKSVEQELAIMRAAVNKPDSFETRGSVTADLGVDNFINDAKVKEKIAAWSKPGTSKVPGNRSRLEDIQTLLRANKLSKGDTPLGILDQKDVIALMSAVQTAKINGQTTEFFLGRVFADKSAKGTLAGAGGGITKTINTALKLLDAGDASDKLSTAYYKAYGRYPTQKQITNFKDQWNAEAKIQQAQGTSYRSKGFNKDVTVGEGFTESEQGAFLNRYLVKNLKMDAANLGGDTKRIYDEIRTVYRDNFLPEPEFSQVAGVVKDLIGTSDINVYNTKVAQIKTTVGKQAAAFYPSLEKELINGDSVETYASVYRNTLATKWGVSAASLVYDKEAQDLVKSAVNFKTSDNKARLMDNNEFNGLVQSTKRWKAGEEAFTSYSNIGDKLIAAFNLQGGVK